MANLNCQILNLTFFTIGTKLPHRHTLATTMLDAEYAHERRKLKNKFVGKWVTLSIDGWSSPQNAPWTGVAVDDYLYKLKDCTGSIKDAQFMAEITEESIRECEEELGCRVASVTGDNARNMVNSRTIIANRRAFKYGCQAHLLNLCMVDFLKDKQRQTITASVLTVLKAFRSVHALRAGLVAYNIGRPPLPCDTRWTSWVKALQYYNKNWAFLSQVFLSLASFFCLNFAFR